MEETILAFMAGVGVAGVLLALLFLSQSIFTVVEGNEAVVLRFGKLMRDAENRIRIYKAGLHFKWPWDQTLAYSTMERVLDLSGPNGGQYALTADGTMLRLDSRIRLSPRIDELYSYLFSLQSPMEHIRKVFICLLRNEIANFHSIDTTHGDEPIGSYDLIRRHRTVLVEKMAGFCSKMGSKYGVHFHSVDLLDILPPPELEVALNSILHSQTQAETQLMRAQAEANQKREAAYRGIEIAKFKAQSMVSQSTTIIETLDQLMRDGSLAFYFQIKRDEVSASARMRIVPSEKGV